MTHTQTHTHSPRTSPPANARYWTRHGFPWHELPPGLLTVEDNGAGAYEVLARGLPDENTMDLALFRGCLAVRPCKRSAMGYADALARVRGWIAEDWT